MGLFSLVHCGEDLAVCVTKHDSSEAVELVEASYDTEKLIHNIHRPLPSAPASHTHKRDFSTIYSNFQTLLATGVLHRTYKLTNLATFFG